MVDDEEWLHILYQDEFTDRGFNVYSAYSGEECLKLFDEKSPDIVILDIRMPGKLDGLQTLSELRLKNVKVPIILHSAFPEFQEDIVSWGANAYITKSSNFEELISTVSQFTLSSKNSVAF